MDIDLVLNLKRAEDLVSKKDKSTGLYPPLEFLRMGASGISTSRQPEGGHFRPSSIMEDVSRKNLHVHAEQVPNDALNFTVADTLKKLIL